MEPYTIGGVTCQIHTKPIQEISADSVLVPVPATGSGKGGVFAAMRQAGAIQGCETLENWHQYSADFMPFGSSMTVPSGLESIPYLSHAASVCEFGSGKDNNFVAVVFSMINVLEDITKRGLKTVNIPLMGTGQMGWLTPEQSARAMMIGVQRFTKAHPDAAVGINFCIPGEEHARLLAETITHPEQYTDIEDPKIRSEKGQAIPPFTEVQPHTSTSDSLRYQVGRTLSKFQGAVARNY